VAIDTAGTPAEQGFAMPAEWEPHAGCLMQWPARADLWEGSLDAAWTEYAVVARAIAAFEPVVMVCPPGAAAQVRDLCGGGVTPWEIPIDDSWARDSGPVFVRGRDGELAVVSFIFNAWGERWHPYADDDALPGRVAERLGLPLFQAPMVLEGGAYFVDGAGSLITTEQCLLSPNRNPTMSRAQIEQTLRDHLGVSTIIWLPFGHSLDTGPAGTDGHVDGVAQWVSPGRILLELPSDPASSEFDRSRANLAALQSALLADGSAIEILPLDPGSDGEVSFANHYLADGAVIVPVNGDSRDDAPLAALGAIYPDREIVGVPAGVLALGGGGPHCITQQVPLGVDLDR
jgi:agmatine deiminase